jgi:hypothetical protein
MAVVKPQQSDENSTAESVRRDMRHSPRRDYKAAYEF